MKTILYYTSNAENEVFEKKIRDNIVKQSDLPIISVSQKPIDFGNNICVSEVGKSYFNEWRQIFIGLKEIKTKYVVFAESDFLYPKDYFEFEPKDNITRYDNVWVIFANRRYGGYHKKAYSEGAQICDRDYILKNYEEFFKGKPEWSMDKTKSYPLRCAPFSWFTGEPCISFKTGNGTRCFTSTTKETTKDLIWGNVDKLREEYLWRI